MVVEMEMKPLVLGAEVAETPEHLVRAIAVATNTQVAEKGLKDESAVYEFYMSCDALNLQRMVWRLQEEWDTPVDAAFVEILKSQLCRARQYDADEFESTLAATRTRARLPFGWTAVDLAWHRAIRNPIRLLHPSLAGAKLPTFIAAIALQLQKIQKEESILLPVEPLRALLQQRKVVVSGSLTRLVDAGVLQLVKAEYHTGSAREYRFVGKEGEQFVFDTR